MAFCQHCTQGTVLPGEPKWSMQPNGAYFAPGQSDQTGTKNAVLLLTDIFGLPLKNSKIMADKFAEQLGCDVWVPDVFAGTSFIMETKRSQRVLSWTFRRKSPRRSQRIGRYHAKSSGRWHISMGQTHFPVVSDHSLSEFLWHSPFRGGSPSHQGRSWHSSVEVACFTVSQSQFITELKKEKGYEKLGAVGCDVFSCTNTASTEQFSATDIVLGVIRISLV